MKNLITLIALLIVLFTTSCDVNTFEEVNTYYLHNNNNNLHSESFKEEKDTFKIKIVNESENIVLHINENKIKGKSFETDYVENNVIVNSGDTILLKEFNSYKYELTNNTKIVLKGNIYYGNSTTPQYEGIILLPLYDAKISNDNIITFTLNDKCKWTDENDNTIFCTISFNITIDKNFDI
jgi:hypothetical protein